MTPFLFSDYLDSLERSLTKTTVKTSEKSLEEVNQLRNHTASLITMQKHLKNYKTLKSLVENYGFNCL
jgi:hypothetical protein